MRSFTYYFRKEGLGRTLFRVLKVTILYLNRVDISFLWFTTIGKSEVLRKINGYWMYLDMKDKGISQDLFVHKKREVISTEYFLNKRVVKEGDTVLEVGANIGYYAFLSHQVVGKPGKIYAVEPDIKNFRILRKNIKKNRCDNIEVFNFAFADKPGEMDFFISDNFNLHNMLSPIKGGKRKKVKTDTIDRFLKGRGVPALIRMDVEGFEFEIFKGMKETLKKGPGLMIEFHTRLLGKRKLEQMITILIQNGYVVDSVILDPYEFLVGRNGKVRNNRLLSYVLGRLGERKELRYGIHRADINELCSFLLERKYACPHILFSKRRSGI